MMRFFWSKSASLPTGQPPRVRGALWWVLEAFAGFTAIILLALGILCARLAMGPLSTDSLTPYVARLLSDPQRGLVTSIAHGELAWDRDRRVLLARLDGLVVNNITGDMVASAPQLEARLDVPALFQGNLKLTDFAVRGAQLQVERLQDGQLVLYGVPAAAPAEDSAVALDTVLADLPKRLQSLNHTLTHIGVVTLDALQINLTDRLTGHTQIVDLPALRLAPAEDGLLHGTADLSLDLAGTRLQLSGSVTLDPKNGAGQVGLGWQDIEPAALAGLDPTLAQLAGVKLPLSGMLQVDYQNETTSIARLTVKGSAGTLQLAPLGPQPLPIRSLAITASVAASVKDGVTAATLNPATIDFAETDTGPTLTVTAALTPGLEKARGLNLSAELTGLPTAKIASVWPDTLSPNARAWIAENIKGGQLDKTTFAMTGILTWPKLATLQIATLGGTFAVSGATATYYGELPPLTKAAATGTYDAKGLKLTLTQGDINGITLQPSDVVIDYAATPETIDITARAIGRIDRVLDTIDRAPLHYAQQVGLKPSDGRGDAAFTMRLAFPLLLDVRLDQIQIGLTGTVKNFGSDTLVPGIPIANGEVAVMLDAKAMTLTGPLTLSGIPATVGWKETFSPAAAAPASVADIKLVIDKQALTQLGVDSDYITGRLPLTLHYQRYPRGVDTVDMTGDLTPTGLHLTPVGYDKAEGVAGSLAAKLRLQSGGPIEITNLNATGPGLIVKANGVVRQNPVALQQIVITQGTFGDTSLTADVSRLGANGWQGRITGSQLDLSSLFDDTAATTPPLSLDLIVDAERARFGTLDGKPREVAPLHAVLRRDGAIWQAFDVSLEAIDGDRKIPFTMQLRPEADGTRSFAAKTKDLGAVLRATNQSDFMRDGALEASGHSAAADKPIPVAVKLDDYRVRGAPFIASLVSAISAEGLLSALSGEEGLAFGKLRGTVQWQGDSLQLQDMKTSGGALGLTVEGNVNLTSSLADLQGTAVPFNSVNSLLGNIPLIGRVLGGTSGIFAASYTARGPLDDLRVSVNPLSILAPGFLRDLFFVGSAPTGTPAGTPASAAPVDVPAADALPATAAPIAEPDQP